MKSKLITSLAFALGLKLLAAQEITPAMITTQPESREIQAGFDMALTAEVKGSPNTYRWTKAGVTLTNDVYIIGANSPTLTLKKVILSDSGAYRLEIDNPLGNASSSVAILKVGGAYIRPADGNLAAHATATSVKGSVLAIDNQQRTGTK